MNRRRKRWLKRKLFRDQNGCCFYCGCRMVLSFAEGNHEMPTLATFEHMDTRLHEPRQRDGKPEIVLACLRCNREKGQRDHEHLTDVPDVATSDIEPAGRTGWLSDGLEDAA